MTDVDDFLAHYGVKGMKWGVRKKREGSSEKSERKPFITRENAKKRALQAAAVLYVGKFIFNIGAATIPGLVANQYNKKQAAAGAAFAATLFAETRGIPNYKTVVL